MARKNKTVRGQKIIEETIQEYLQRIVDNHNWSRFFAELEYKIATSPEIEAYRVARAKSRAQAASTVFI